MPLVTPFIYNAVIPMVTVNGNELHLLRYIYLSNFFGVTNTFRVHLKMGTQNSFAI